MTNINIFGILITFIYALILIFADRRYAVAAIILFAISMTFGQIVYIFGLHFTMLRLLIFVGLVRLIIRKEIGNIEFNNLDKIFLIWLISHVVIFVGREQTVDALINRLGYAYNSAGLYFIFRALVINSGDYEIIKKSLLVAVIVLSMIMLYEHLSGRNIYSIFGDVPEYVLVRDDRLRCQGPFRHPILAGTFAATTLPIFVAMIFDKSYKYAAIIGSISAVAIVYFVASGGPLLALCAGITGMLMWYFRRHMNIIRWGIVISLVGLHMVMKAPVWYLLARISSITGGTGWHRAELIDQAVRNIDKWWLIGMNMEGTVDWIPYILALGSEDQVDITNLYIAEGINGGILTLVLFICIIITAYKFIGYKLELIKQEPFKEQILIWGIGVSLLTHVISFISVTYFDQMIIFWFLLVAMIAIMKKPVPELKNATKQYI